MLIPTKISYLVTLALIASGAGWVVASVWPVLFDVAFTTPWLTAITMWLIALALFIWTILARKKIQPKKGPRLDPLLAARSAALAMSASRVGALAMGFYVGILIENLIVWDSPASKDRALISGLTALASLITIGIGLWLEHICRLPKPPVDSSAVPNAS